MSTRIEITSDIRILDCDNPPGYAVWDDLDDDPSPVFRTEEAAIAYARELAADRGDR